MVCCLYNCSNRSDFQRWICYSCSICSAVMFLFSKLFWFYVTLQAVDFVKTEYICKRNFAFDDKDAYLPFSPTLVTVAVEFPTEETDDDWKLVAFNANNKLSIPIDNISDGTVYYHQVRLTMGIDGQVYVIHENRDKTFFVLLSAKLVLEKNSNNLYEPKFIDVKSDIIEMSNRLMSDASGAPRSVWQVVHGPDRELYNISSCEIITHKGYVYPQCQEKCNDYVGRSDDHCIYDPYTRNFVAYNGEKNDDSKCAYDIFNCISYTFIDTKEAQHVILTSNEEYILKADTTHHVVCLKAKEKHRYYHALMFDPSWPEQTLGECTYDDMIDKIFAIAPTTTSTKATTKTTKQVTPFSEVMENMENGSVGKGEFNMILTTISVVLSWSFLQSAIGLF